MERVHKAVHRSLLGEEKQEMLGLNRRLENYLNRVKLLEEENALLAKEIQSLRHGDQRALTRRKGLEEELQQARLEVDEAWRDKVLTELEVQRLAEELQALNLHRQREAQAHMKAKTMLERSRKDLEEERRAQMWLREKSSQLEHELRLLIQNHQEDVAHLEATLGRSRSTAPPALAQRGNQAPSLLQLGQDYSQRATRAWQEAAEAYQAQLAQLEESLNQTRSRLSQVTQEKSEGHMKLQTLQKEMSSAQDIRRHLEKSGAEQRARHGREIQELQEHVEDLEVEEEELAQQINHMLVQNQGLLQLKMSLGLEVATYRALLDSDVSLFHQPTTVSDPDAVFWRSNHKVASLPPASGVTVITAKPVSARKPGPLAQAPQKTTGATQSTLEPAYPKIMQDGAVEKFRPQEVCEKVTQAEPLSPPSERQEEEEHDVEAPASCEPGRFEEAPVDAREEGDEAETLVQATGEETLENVEDQLYPDGEEMDTWDSVMERKADGKTDDAATDDGDKRQHAEPEDDISAKEQRVEGKVFDEETHVETDVDAEPPLSDNDDSQNVSVSWRTEVESDNTLADTRPLIQYRNEEREAGDTGTWSEGRRFGTMEDLCEDAGGDVLDEDYDLGYARDHDPAREMADPTDEELHTDRLLEEELDLLCTDGYSAHFASWQHRREKAEEQEAAESEEAELILHPHEKLLASPAGAETQEDDEAEELGPEEEQIHDFPDSPSEPEEDVPELKEGRASATSAADFPDWENLSEAEDEAAHRDDEAAEASPDAVHEDEEQAQDVSELGASPDDVRLRAAEPSFAELNGEAPAAVKQLLHSGEADGESWSSGEEPM